MWSAENSATGLKINEVGGSHSTLRSLLGRGWLMLIVFSDSVALIQVRAGVAKWFFFPILRVVTVSNVRWVLFTVVLFMNLLRM